MKKVFVIGSNSFSGSDFIDLLLEQGEYEVVGISRSPEKSALFLPYKQRRLSHFQFYQMDLNKDLQQIKLLLDTLRPEYIVNFAAQSEVAPSWENPHHWFQTNVVALTQFANLIKEANYLKRYVHISSPEVYGSCVGNVLETAPLNPSTPYAASKAAGDLSLFTFAKNFPFPLAMVRATNVYGAYQQLFKIIPRSVIYLKLGKLIELHGGGMAVKSYIHIRDVSCGELAIMERGHMGAIYHLSPDQGVAVHEVVQTICNQMHVDFSSATKKVAERLGQDKAYTIDSTKARMELGWKPRITLSEGIGQTVAWIENSFAAISKQPLNYIHKE